MPEDLHPDDKAAQWQFVRLKTEWVWRKLRVDGTLVCASGSDFRDYAFAVNDAINHGFRPSRDYWAIVTHIGTTHFRKGERPAFVPNRDGDPFPPLEGTRPTAGPEGTARIASKSRAEQ